MQGQARRTDGSCSKPQLPDGLGGEVFIGKTWGEGCGVSDFLLIGRHLVLGVRSPASTGWGLSPRRRLKAVVVYMPSGGTGTCPLLLYCFLMFLLCFCIPSLPESAFWNSGRCRRLKEASLFFINRKQGNVERICTWRASQGFLRRR